MRHEIGLFFFNNPVVRLENFIGIYNGYITIIEYRVDLRKEFSYFKSFSLKEIVFGQMFLAI